MSDEEEKQPESPTPAQPEPAKKKNHKDDKIFNNRYNSGEGLSENDQTSYSNNLAVAQDYADSYLKGIYEYEDELNSRATLDTIINFVNSTAVLTELFDKARSNKASTKVKFTKDEVNFIFSSINSEFENKKSTVIFYNPIYILEAISAISSIEYKKLFDMMNTDNQEVLIVELNKKYKFLEGKMNKKRLH